MMTRAGVSVKFSALFRKLQSGIDDVAGSACSPAGVDEIPPATRDSPPPPPPTLALGGDAIPYNALPH